MTFGSYYSSIADLVTAKHLGWNISFAQTPDPDIKVLLQNHFPEVVISTSSVPNINVDVFSTRSPGPPRFVQGREPKLDKNYLELALFAFELAAKLSSRWLVWEVHPNILSSNKGKDFGRACLSLANLGYGFAYRVLDSQYFGVPQARRSLFLVGYNGDWRPPAAVLFQQQTHKEYYEEDREKSIIVRGTKEMASGGPFVLPYKVAHHTNLYKQSPRLPYVKVSGSFNFQHTPFAIIYNGIVRHFSPTEAELLQGYTENFTKVPGKLQPFGYHKRLSIIGNSGCVPVYMWLFNRIQQVHGLSIE